MKLSVIIITYNEEKDITACIRSVSFASEVIVIDSHSTDKTVDIAKKEGAIVYSTQFSDFASLRNFGLSKSTGDWIFYLDADERVTESLKHEIIKTLNSRRIVGIPTETSGQKNNHYTAYKIQRKNFYFGNHEWPVIEMHNRLFKRDSFIKWTGKIHESPHFQGESGILQGFLLHYSHKNLELMVDKTNKWSDIDAELLYDAHHPPVTWWRIIRIMLTKFWNSYVVQSGWKVGAVGLIESIFQAYSYFIVYSKLWEKQRESDPNNKNVTHSNDTNK